MGVLRVDKEPLRALDAIHDQVIRVQVSLLAGQALPARVRAFAADRRPIYVVSDGAVALLQVLGIRAEAVAALGAARKVGGFLSA